MRAFLLIACLLTSLAVFAAPHEYGDIQLNRTDITEVYDGDTLFLSKPEWPAVLGQHIGVRLYGIDTPERHSRCELGIAKNHEEILAMRARKLLLERLDAAHTIELRNLERDKYFRLLAHLYIDGEDIADALIKSGLAVPYHGEKKVGWCEDTRSLANGD